MPQVTTIKVPSDLRDRIAERAKQDGVTLAEAIVRALDAADEARFWGEVEDKMAGVYVSGPVADEARRLEGDLTEGLDPDEDWSDIL